MRVLGIDQLADDRTDRPTLAKAVTLEVDTQSAQKLTLAGTIGSLSLALRPAGATTMVAAQRVTGGALFGTEPEIEEQTLAKTPSPDGLIGVTRAVIRTEYAVPTHSRRN